VILFHFTGEVTGGTLIIIEDGVGDGKWIKVAELKSIDDEELREVSVTKQIISRLANQEIHSLSVFNDQLWN
jgi:hypothetical protein